MFKSEEEKQKFVEAYNDYISNPTVASVGNECDMSERTVRRRAEALRGEGHSLINRNAIKNGVSSEDLEQEPDEEILKENVKLGKKSQRNQDINRIERKSFREYARIENAVSEYVEKLVDTLEDSAFNFDTIKHNNNGTTSTGIFQISDLHLNEEINLPSNKYNFQIASARLKEYVRKAKQYFLINGVTDVVVAMTGDILNSDRRFDEMLTNATNRAKATFVAVDILQQVLRDMNEEFNLTVVSITGNESRIDKDVGWETAMAQNNFDFVCHNMLSYLFAGKDGVRFVECETHPLERVIEVSNSNVLLIHGHNGIATNPEKKIQGKIMHYNSQGVNIDYTIMGHVHSAQVGDMYARSSGLPGSNSYSHNALNLTGRASQNIYIFHDNKSHDCIKIDLQNVDEDDYYPYDKANEAYNNKLDKSNSDEVEVFRLVI